jgi:hypothetical protein
VLLVTAALVAAVTAAAPAGGAGATQSDSKQLDPAAWGSDHVGEPIPEYVTGDECLFCHRNDVGPTWSDNEHQRTMRAIDRDGRPYHETAQDPAVAPFLEEATVELGAGGEVVRFLEPSGRYGQVALLDRGWTRDGRPPLASAGEPPAWDDDRFGERCAGCHATAVDTAVRAFSSPSLDCYTCHGAVDINHGEDTSRMLFAKARTDPAPVLVSICGQCHIRSGRSRSSGLPYPNNFVAGDNLFRDFAVDLSPAALGAVGPADRHVLENVRAVVLEGKEAVTCLTCHSVHGGSSERHEGLRTAAACFTCHVEGEPLTAVKSYLVTSELCEY